MSDDGPRTRSRRGLGLLLGSVAVVAAAAGAVGALALGNDDDEAPGERPPPLAAQLHTVVEGVTVAQAECLADHLVDALGEETATALDLVAPSLSALDPEVVAAIDEGRQPCGVADGPQADPEADAGGDTETDAPAEMSPEDLAAYEADLADFYTSSLQVSPEQGACVAAAVVDAGVEAQATGATLPELPTILDGCGIET